MRTLVCLTLLLFSMPLAADSRHHHHGASPYAGAQARAIKSLSADDIAELKRGGGWGFAKAAELNGVPGPAHLLELKDDIPLTSEQVEKIESLFADMQARAAAQGAIFIEREAALDKLFKDRMVTDATLRAALSAVADARETLRYIHLSAHLRTPDILSADQIAAYNALRGYASAAPCDAVPARHDPDMWRRHNGCE